MPKIFSREVWMVRGAENIEVTVGSMGRVEVMPLFKTKKSAKEFQKLYRAETGVKTELVPMKESTF